LSRVEQARAKRPAQKLTGVDRYANYFEAPLAKEFNAKIWAQDSDFKHIPGVEYFSKK